MAPKRAPKAPTRRSGRIASRENSKEPSAEPAAPAPPPPPPAEETEEAAPTRRPTVKKAIAVKTLSTEEMIHVLKNRVRDAKYSKPVDAIKFINKLTPTQCEAVILGLTKQNIDLEDRVEELEQDLEYSTNEVNKWKERSRPNIRRDAFYRKMDTFAVADDEAEKQTSDGPVAPAQSPPQSEAQEAPAPAALSSPQTVAKGITAAAAAPAPSPWKKLVAGLSGYLPGLRKRPAEDEAATAEPTPKRTRFDEPEKTPVRARPTHEKHLMRSVKNPAVPSSLSTITERSEQSLLDMALDTTPSRKKKFDSSSIQLPSSVQDSTTPMPQPSSSLQNGTTTMPPTFSLQNSLTSMQAPSSAPPSATPRRQRRSAAALAAARRTLGSNTPAPIPYAWEKQQAAQKPKEKNADARAAKLLRYNDLRAELERLRADADIQEIEAHSVHRRKKVKIDNLAVIPHNRPGDPSGTFRVPDPDSDDEISVDMDYEENMNVFDASEKAQEESIEPVEVVEPIAPVKPLQPEEPAFMFPEVGQKTATYHVTKEFQEVAGDLFAKGLAEFIGA